MDFSTYTTSTEKRNLELLRIPYPNNKIEILKKHITYAFQISRSKI